MIALTSFLTALKDRESYEGDRENLKIMFNFELPGEVNYSCYYLSNKIMLFILDNYFFKNYNKCYKYS